MMMAGSYYSHDDVIKLKHCPLYLPFVRGIHRSQVNSPHKGQWCGALMFSLICAWINTWVNNRETGDLRRHCAHFDVIVMVFHNIFANCFLETFMISGSHWAVYQIYIHIDEVLCGLSEIIKRFIRLHAYDQCLVNTIKMRWLIMCQRTCNNKKIVTNNCVMPNNKY